MHLKAVAPTSSSDEYPEDEDEESGEQQPSSSHEEDHEGEDSSKCYSDDEWATLADLQKVRALSSITCLNARMASTS